MSRIGGVPSARQISMVDYLTACLMDLFYDTRLTQNLWRLLDPGCFRSCAGWHPNQTKSSRHNRLPYPRHTGYISLIIIPEIFYVDPESS